MDNFFFFFERLRVREKTSVGALKKLLMRIRLRYYNLNETFTASASGYNRWVDHFISVKLLSENVFSFH